MIERLEQLQKQIQGARETYQKLEEKENLTAEVLTNLKLTVSGSWKAYQEQHMNLLALTTREHRYEIPHFRNNMHDSCEDLYTELAADIAKALLSISNITQVEPTTIETKSETRFHIEIELMPLTNNISRTHSESHAKIVCHLCNKNHIITHCTHFG